MSATIARSRAITVEGLHKSFGPVHALRGVDLAFPGGGIYGLVGPNGSGKTTLFSVLCGFLRPDRGVVSIGGQVVRPDNPPPRGTVSILPQDASFMAHMPVVEQLAYYGRLSGVGRPEAEAQALRALETVGLKGIARRVPDTLSHGMRKRVGIAQAFLGKPDLVILDEPTAGLDPHASREIHAILRRMRDDQTVLVSSHNLDEVEELCSQVAIIHQGRVVKNEKLERLLGGAGEVSFRMGEPPPRAALERLQVEHDWVVSAVWDTDGARLRVTFDATAKPADEAGRDLVTFLVGRGVSFLEMHVGKSLEDRFIEETR